MTQKERTARLRSLVAFQSTTVTGCCPCTDLVLRMSAQRCLRPHLAPVKGVGAVRAQSTKLPFGVIESYTLFTHTRRRKVSTAQQTCS